MAMDSKKSRYFYIQKQFFTFFIFISLFISVFLVVHYDTDRKFKTDSLNEKLQIFNAFFLEELDLGFSPSQFATMEYLPYKNVRVTLMDLDGNVLFDNRLDTSLIGNLKDRPEVQEALISGTAYVVERKSQSDGVDYFYSAMKGEHLIVRAAIPYTLALRQLLRADLSLLWLVLSILLIAGMVGFFGTRRLSEVIKRLNSFAAKAEKGEYISENERDMLHDELSDISNHIMVLYQRLQKTAEERDKAHQIAFEKEQEKIALKKELTMGINHELKTPVSAVMVCLETLMNCRNLSEEKQMEMLERSYANCERLRNLLLDVSCITRMEEGTLHMQKEPVILNDLVAGLLTEIEDKINASGMSVYVDPKGKKVKILGNIPTLDSLFRNLIDNAIAYSEGKNIYILLKEDREDYCRISVEDDGVGVSPEHLSRLFERFYRVDKGRSRQMGGTGLGLAIVKHAVYFHGGEITVDRSGYGGLKFEFTLMKK